jgi:methyltransferase-like protein
LTREQYLDFVQCRRFRQTLLTHHEAAIKYPPEAAAVERFHISSQANSVVAGSADGGQPIERFANARGGALETSHPLAVRAFHRLRDRWPATVSFEELFQSTAADAGVPPALWGAKRGELMQILLEAYRVKVVDFRRTPVHCATAPSACPATSRFARWQLKRSFTVTTLRHDNLRIEDELGKRLLLLMDGTRPLADLARDMAAEPVAAAASGGISNESVANEVTKLAGLALLEA